MKYHIIRDDYSLICLDPLRYEDVFKCRPETSLVVSFNVAALSFSHLNLGANVIKTRG